MYALFLENKKHYLSWYVTIVLDTVNERFMDVCVCVFQATHMRRGWRLLTGTSSQTS